MSTITLPDFIEATISSVISRGAGRPGISAVVMTMSTSGTCSAYIERRAAVEVLAHLPGVAVGADLRLAGRHGHVLTAQRADLLGHLRADVGRPHDRPQAARRADRRQARDAGAGDQHLRRRHLAGRGDLPGEEPAEGVRRLDHRPVAGDVGHRGQHVHRLRPGDPRDGVHRQRGDRPLPRARRPGPGPAPGSAG